MKLGIVGHAQEKFTADTEAVARRIIREEILRLSPEAIVSGHCPMGGVDIYAEEIAVDLHIPAIIHAPVTNRWSDPGGFRDRNLAIAAESDLVLVVVVSKLPPDFSGMRFETGCYHCGKRNPIHIKSGGCWTAWKAKDRFWRII